ncbi:6510_t:CDS:2 [Funneliformis geosporum]|uniref:Chitin synthase n=1 Tax=Funneliformis geosporum TaxID=1117311 RepID=A0A9W4SUF6_9GLOM|nr:1185_t:CDS:2 [Funneliformis geosporum]CAI2181976.1 6510_t:CDS:2 [Funneliformis geosporum]
MAGPINSFDLQNQRPLSLQYQSPLNGDHSSVRTPPPIQTTFNYHDEDSSRDPPQYARHSVPESLQSYIDYYQQAQRHLYGLDENDSNGHHRESVRYTSNNNRTSKISFQYQSGQIMKSKRDVELTKGNLVLNCPVPEKVLRNVKHVSGDEFTHMRYTAVTCDPNDFVSENYSLRPQIYGRQTEIMIVVTMYNEDDRLFIKTMSSIIKNISHMCSKENSKTWGKSGWQKVVVVFVADGRNKINKRVLDVLEVMGVYQEGVLQDSVVGKPVTGHLFEYTSQLMVDSNFNIRGSDQNIPPIQTLFLLKEKNAKKINSHRWFFNAFAAQLNPNICILLDVGTKPTHSSIYHLWKAFDRDPNVGGACGEVTTELGRKCINLVNPLVAAQNFEYKMANILDKPLESVFGFISVLPGAFSAYRYKALLNTTPDLGPLASYFKGETMHGSGNAGIIEANMYLAEDRILSFELVSKKYESWKLKYVKDAKAETDVPVTVSEFISQRRRWLNGSFFAAVYSFVNFLRIWTSGQSIFRKFLLTIIFIYNAIQLLYNWFAIGNFYMAFYFLTTSLMPPQGTELIKAIYGIVLLTIFISSMGNRPQGSKWLYMACIILFGVIMIVILYCGAYTVFLALKDTNIDQFPAKFQIAEFRNIMLSISATYGLYTFASLIHGEPWHMITSLFQSILLIPFYINILMVYSFCNIHDVSWGTKGDNTHNGGGNGAQPGAIATGVKDVVVQVNEIKNIEDTYDEVLMKLKFEVPESKQHRDADTKKSDYYKQFRTNVVLAWVFSNIFLVFFFTSEFWDSYIKRTYGEDAYNPYLTSLFWAVNVISAFRAFGCVWYLLLRLIFG